MQRSKWRVQKKGINVGDVVLVKEDNSPPTHWPLGVITKLHPGSDNTVRVTHRMRSGGYEKMDNSEMAPTREFKRPVAKLIYLPTNDEYGRIE